MRIAKRRSLHRKVVSSGLNDVMLPAVDASGTNIERFRSLFEVPSILEQSECLLFHIDTDSTEHHGELRLYREKMDFL